MAAERAELLCSLLGIEDGILSTRTVIGDLTAAGILSAVSVREEAFVVALAAFHKGTQPELAGGGESLDFDAALARCVGARSKFLDAFALVSDDVLYAGVPERATTQSPLAMATQCYWNDSSLSLRVGAWSREQRLGFGTGPPSLLRAATRAARKELLTTVALVPAAARDLAIFDGGRSLAELFQLVSELERSFLQALAAGGAITLPGAKQRTPADHDAWGIAWSDLHGTHSALLALLDDMQQDGFAAALSDGQGNVESVYTWARGCLLHDRLHAAHIRSVLELDWPERLLR